MHPEMRKRACRTFYPVIVVLLLFLMAGQASAGESVTTLNERTITVTGYWEKNNASRIPFAVDDFQGFRFINLSYAMMNPTAATPSACGLVFRLTTDDYFAAARNGSSLVFVFLGEGYRFFNTGFITFDPRTNPEPSWQKGRYWLLVHVKPENCVNEAHIRIDLVRDAGEISETVTGTLQETTPVMSLQGTTPAPTMTLNESAPPPGTTQAAGGPGSPMATPTKAPLQEYAAIMATMMAMLIAGWKLRRP
jgi:hypothetical protein